MKRLPFIITIFFTIQCFSQTDADAILGKWLKLPKQDIIVEVFKEGTEYKGKIIWAKDTLKMPVGYAIFEKLQYNTGDALWDNGVIHDPRSGKTYDAVAELQEDGLLEVRGYKGIKLFGVTRSFKRVN